MGLIDRLAAEAATCTLKTGDRVALAGGSLTGVLVQNGGYGYFKVRLDGSGKHVIRRFTDLALIPAS